MIKLILQMNLSIDGYAADKEGKVDWMLTEEDDRQLDVLNNITKNVGHIILGRKMAEESIPYWENAANSSPLTKENEYAKFFVHTPKTVFSQSLKNISGKNVQIKKSDLRAGVLKLKQASQKNIIVYGGAKIVSSLIENRLVDELNLFIHPVVIGDGLKIFNSRNDLQLMNAQFYCNGIVYNQFSFKS
jgi:dihydrofolate reductase